MKVVSLSFSIWFLLFYSPLIGYGQLTNLDTIEVTATNSLRMAVGNPIQLWKIEDVSPLSGHSVADLLTSESNIFIKSYGAGSLATSSIRGGSAGHTAVLWNGIPLQSPMLGLLDLSLLPIQAVEQIRLEKGGNAALWGSGAIGGVLALDNKSDFKNRLNIQSFSEFGSFGRWGQQLQIGGGNASFQSKTKLAHLQTQNNFQYRIRPDLPSVQQSNARLSQQNIWQDFYWKPKANQQLGLHFWQQFSHRQIPPTITQNNSQAYQDERTTRLLLHWQQRQTHGMWQSKIAYFDEHLDYFNYNLSKNHFSSFFAELQGQWTWNTSHSLLVGGTHRYTTAMSGGYETNPKEQRTALFSSYQWQQPKFQAQISLRQALVDASIVPLLPAFDFRYNPQENWQIQAKISRNYRLPTLNDRYWRPGGNPNLRPEQGWSAALHLAWQTERVTASLGGFHRKINDWILWSKLDNQAFWVPNNIAQVWSRGTEAHFSWKKSWAQLEMGYDWIRSTNEIALTLPRIEKGQQLYYTPQHQGFIRLKLEKNNWKFRYRQAYTAASNGINADLAPYWLANAQLQYHYKKKKHRTTLFFQLFNIWDTSYFVIERRVMPGRHFSIGLHWQYHSN